MDRGDIVWANVPEELRPAQREDRVRERRGGPVDIPGVARLRQQLLTADRRREEALRLQADLQAQQAEIARQLAYVNELVANMGEVIRVRADQIRIAEAGRERQADVVARRDGSGAMTEEREEFRAEQRRLNYFSRREVQGRDGVRRVVVPRELEHVYGMGNVRFSGTYLTSQEGPPTFVPASVIGGRRCGNCRYFGHTRGRCPYDSDNTGSHWSHGHSESIGIRDAYVAGVALLR